MTKKPYVMEISLQVVVMAEDSGDAISRVRYLYRDIVDNESDPYIFSLGQIKTREELRCVWDEEYIPYGGDGNTRLGDIL